jgi:glycerol-3-phosphate acyltransferase PlsY
MSPYVLLVLAYAAGATPTSFWLGKAAYGVDLRTKGSGNLGGSNTFRVLGWRAALPVVLVDVGKGWLPVWYFAQIQAEASSSVLVLAYCGAAVVGHVFSFWVGFKGGKGIATGAGALLALSPLAVGVALAVWLAVLGVSRIVSVASLTTVLTLPGIVYFLPGREDSAMLWFTGALAVFVVWSHRSNIGRLLRGEESSFRRDSSGPGPELGDDEA